ncbi:MAG: putative molybdenum cofactor guanylyltransferase [Candidatus Roseilinea sp.]|nr:MAG: putative molybdenum cofactor guanylyltransferase [Candidatus Roseilinea sp.]GIV84741.1 MAG: putative molybdenum cofactor guanylyltransferase [Candidatus Roseilinea sp.]
MTDERQPSLTVAILCGGQSRRMGQDKGLMPFLGRPLVQRVVERVQPLSGEIVLVTNRPDDYRFLGLSMLPDALPGRGPLGGAFTAVMACRSTALALVACDMPFVNAAVLARAYQVLAAEGCDAVVPLTANGPEALHAVYRAATCAPVMKAALDAGELKMADWLPRVRARFITQEEIIRLDPEGLAFVNVNTLEAFRAAEQRARE